MRKEDLKDGMVVELEWCRFAKRRYIKMGERLVDSESWADLYEATDDLCWDNCKVSRVFVNKSMSCLDDMFKDDHLILIWEREREINWNKVPKWTKVQVRDTNNEKWVNKYFLGVSYDYRFDATSDDEFTFSGMVERWRECRMHPSVKVKDEWCY